MCVYTLYRGFCTSMVIIIIMGVLVRLEESWKEIFLGGVTVTLPGVLVSYEELVVSLKGVLVS